MSEFINDCEIGKDFSFRNNLVKNDFVVLPADDPISGTFGCIAFEKGDDKNVLTYASKVYESCEKIDCDSDNWSFDVDWFLDALQDSLDHNYPTFICHQPKFLRIGFVSLRNNGNQYFSLGIANFKKYLESRKKD